MPEWTWPLTTPPLLPDYPGRFGATRKHDIHTGVDLYCPVGTRVWAVEAGTVVAIEEFTGPRAESPWWNETWAVLVEGESGVVVYGEIEPRADLKVGTTLVQKEYIGRVAPVLKKFKGRPMVMLHLELMTSGATETVWWKKGDLIPEVLCNPEPLLGEHPRFNLDSYDKESFRT